MNRFRFKLKSVLRHREILEEEKKREFGVALNHMKHEENHYKEIENTIDSHEKLMEKSSFGRLSVRDILNKFNYARHLDSKRGSQKNLLQKAREALETQRVKLMEAMKRKKTLERLKERDRQTYNDTVRKEEQALIDELTSLNSNKQNHKKR